MPPSRIIKSSAKADGAYAPFDRGELHVLEAAEADSELEEETEPLPDPAEILAAAREEAERKVQEAYAEGFRRGEEAGKAAFLERVGEAATVFASSAEAMGLAQKQFLSTFEHAIVALSRAAAERVLRRELRYTDVELIQSTVHAAARQLTERESFDLRLHPEDVSALEENGVDIVETMDQKEKVRIVPDETVARGGCVIDSASLRIDAQLEEQLARIFDALDD